MKTLVFMLTTALACASALAQDYQSDDNGMPPEPPEWNSGSSSRQRHGPPPGGRGGMRGGPGGQSGRGRQGGGMRGDDPSDASQYSGMTEVTDKKSLKNVSISSATKNTSPIYVKTGGSLTLKGGKLSSTASGSNGILVIGKGAKAVVENVDIATISNSSRGLYAFQKGEIYAKNVRISTRGAHCAAMATDRGEGTVSVDGGVLNTAGDGSPCIYSTGELSAKNVTGHATGSEAMVIEGRNSITLENADLRGDRKCGAMLYQSFSGDARTGVATLKMKASRLEAKTGPMFFVTNTRATIEVTDCELVTSSKTQPLLKVAPARWGRSGQNGGNVTLTAKNQKLEGDIEVSSTSTAMLDLQGGTVLTGTLDAKGEARELKVKLARGAKLVLTGDSSVTSLENADASGSNIIRNGHKLVVKGT